MTDCINFILSQYSGTADHVILVGHSMGGVISSSVFLNPLHQAGSVKSIITMGSPHHSSAASFDWHLERFYNGIHDLWRSGNEGHLGEVGMKSILFGAHDKVISSELGFLDSPHVAWQWTGAVAKLWCYPNHNPFSTCKSAVEIGVKAVLDQFSAETGLLLSKSERLGYRDVSTELIEAKSVEPSQQFIQPRPNEARSLFGRAFDISTTNSGEFNIEILSDSNLPNCLRVETTPRLDYKLEMTVIPNESSRNAWYLNINSASLSIQAVKIDARACTGTFGYLHQSKSTITRRPLWSTLRFYKGTFVTFPTSQHLHRKVEIKVPASDVYYTLKTSCLPAVQMVRVRNSKTGETIWFSDQQSMVVRMHRNPHYENDFRTDQVDIWTSPECSKMPTTITMSISIWATAGLWLRRYFWWIIGIGFVAALRGVFDEEPLRYWQPDIFMLFTLILLAKHLLGVKYLPNIIWKHMLLSADPGMLMTIFIFAFFWLSLISILHLILWSFSRVTSLVDPKKRFRSSFQVIIYPAALLAPIPYAVLACFLSACFVLLTRPENSQISRSFVTLLAMVSIVNMLFLGVWPKNLMNGNWSLLDHAPWLTLPIATATDLIAYGRITGAVFSRKAGMTIRWILTALLLAWSRRMLYILTYILAIISTLKIVLYAATRPPRVVSTTT